MKIIRLIFIPILFIFLFTTLLPPVHAQPSTPIDFEATVIHLESDHQRDTDQSFQPMRIEVQGTQGEWLDQVIILDNDQLTTSALPDLKVGDNVIVTYMQNPDGSDLFLITDYVRRPSLMLLFALFVFLTLIIARSQGLASLLGMIISFLIIFYWILPQILKGVDPLFTTISACLIIIPVNFYLSHGLNKKTTVAVIGTLIALVITGLLSRFFIGHSKLTGFGSEEANFLQYLTGGQVDMKALLLSGIIISLIGVLDDITVSQAAIVAKLKEANHKLKQQELFIRAMDVGKDHIASLVNTLILVYAGAALPLLLLFINSQESSFRLLNYEMVAEEIVRMLLASIGLIIAVPITTFIASISTSTKNK